VKSQIGKTFMFSSSHILWREDWSPEQNVEVFGQCANDHGHNYEMTVGVLGDVDEETGMVINYSEIGKVVKPVVEMLDHTRLNDHFEHLTTAELMSSTLVSRFAVGLFNHNNIEKVFVRLQETPKTFAQSQIGREEFTA